MDRDELYEQWQANKDRPAYVREHREELTEHLTELKDPIPEEGSLHEIREWLDDYKGTVTRQLSEGED
jgi:hypothetical protein